VETLERYLERLASAQPAPGGGSAAAVAAGLGAALVEMVARICAANPRYAGQRALAERVAEAGEQLRRRLEAARDLDERAFSRVVAAQGLPRATPEETQARAKALEAALHAAAEAPLRACELCIDVLRLAVQILEIPNRNLASDLGCAAEFGFAALEASAYNVRVNHRYMRDTAAIDRQAARLSRYESEGQTILARVRAEVATALAR
jgi:formiminotetrahydrofolate cyclodeaminase